MPVRREKKPAESLPQPIAQPGLPPSLSPRPAAVAGPPCPRASPTATPISTRPMRNTQVAQAKVIPYKVTPTSRDTLGSA